MSVTLQNYITNLQKSRLTDRLQNSNFLVKTVHLSWCLGVILVIFDQIQIWHQKIDHLYSGKGVQIGVEKLGRTCLANYLAEEFSKLIFTSYMWEKNSTDKVQADFAPVKDERWYSSALSNDTKLSGTLSVKVLGASGIRNGDEGIGNVWQRQDFICECCTAIET